MALYGPLKRWLRSTVSFLRERPARLLGVTGALVAGTVAGIPAGDEVYTYLWADYRFCNDCHVHDYANEAYEDSVHFGLTTCHDCHLVPIRHYPRNLWLTLFDRPESAEDIHRPDVESLICTRCHSADTDDQPLTGPMGEEMRAMVVKIDDSPMHLLHMRSETRDPGAYRGGAHEDAASDAEDKHVSGIHGVVADWDAGVITCMDCHGAESNRAHSFGAKTANCVACHQGVAPEGSQISQLECRECHFAGFVGKSGGR